MGNQLAAPRPVADSGDYFLHELPGNSSYKETLASGRLLSTLLCIHDEGLIVVKVYFKRAEALKLKVGALTLSVRPLPRGRSRALRRG